MNTDKIYAEQLANEYAPNRKKRLFLSLRMKESAAAAA